ncbi:ureidoglycolate lyase [Parapusillimonas sp. SGNA-6]|nr:ureidoglycolate lyase [Parapusillimonas sp. SGNA-6]
MTTTTTLLVEPLTRAAFAPFGDVIETADDLLHFPINDGNTERYHDLADIDPGPDGRAIVSLFRGKPRTLPFDVVIMERHPKGSQAFIPLSGRPYLAVVAPAGDAPTAADLRAFLCQADQGVNYARGVWHHPLLALEQTSDFLVIDRSGPGDNCDVITLDEGAVIPLLGSAP